VEALTPRHEGPGAGTPARATDHARSLLARARVGLGLLAVLIALPVGAAAGGAATPTIGLLAGAITLLVCWGLLAGGEAVWRAHLTTRDLRSWDRAWARVEPVWSRRTV